MIGGCGYGELLFFALIYCMDAWGGRDSKGFYISMVLMRWGHSRARCYGIGLPRRSSPIDLWAYSISL